MLAACQIWKKLNKEGFEIEVTIDLVGGKSGKKELKRNIVEILSDALRQIRDFVRQCYGIGEKPRIKEKSKRRE